MATGDLHGNLERLRVQLQSIQYPHALDVQSLKEGIPAVILPLIHYALLGYSRHLARFLSANGYELWAKSDLRFMESTLKFLRQEFNYRSVLTMAQMFARGYTERKLLFLCDVIQMSKRKHQELLKLVHEKKPADKVHIDTSNLATARRACEGACATSSPFMESKPWEQTLRIPEGKGSVDVMSVASARSDLPLQDAAPEIKPELHPREISKGSNIGSRMSSPDSKKSVGDDLSQNTRDSLPQAQPPQLPESLSGSHDDDHQEQNLVQDFHEELCQKIMEMADRLEARFSTLEDGITKARETLQDKLVSLEGRVSLLETVIPQAIELDSTVRELQQHQASVSHQENGFENSERKHQQKQNLLPQQDNMFDGTNWVLQQLERNSEHTTPRSPFQENLQNCECGQPLWIAQQKCPAAIVEASPCFNLINSRQPCGASLHIPMSVLEQHSQTIRDISNTHQYMENNSSKLRAELNEDQIKMHEKLRPLYHENAWPVQKPLDAQEFAADIQARFNRTMELLYQDGRV